MKNEGYNVKHKRSKRGSSGPGDGTCAKHRPKYKNHVWRYYFETLQTTDKRAVRILNIIDEYTRECLHFMVGLNISSQDVMDRLFGLFLCRGVPKYIRTANGPEFTIKAIRGWLSDLGIKVRFIEST